MKQGYLTDYFESVVAKMLRAVEVDPETSNQHEINGVAPLKKMFGVKENGDKDRYSAKFFWFGEVNEGVVSEGFVTWADPRWNTPKRSEHRLYYSDTEIFGLAKPGDTLFIAKRTNNEVFLIITASGSTVENQLFWLFDVNRPTGEKMELGYVDERKELDFTVRFIFDELGIEIEEPESEKLGRLLEEFKGRFPTTLEFSQFTRKHFPEADPIADPDAALLYWMENEEKLFRHLERYIISEKLKKGFMIDGGADVEGFMQFSLSVQNKRKSRAGYALENHVEIIFQKNKIRYSKGRDAITENKKKPDFLFPGGKEYRDPAFPETRLTMLGVKTSLKDRWRQVLSEANRIKAKHLLTLEPGISYNQTEEIKDSNLQLVIPAGLHQTFLQSQKESLLNVKDFIGVVRSRQE